MASTPPPNQITLRVAHLSYVYAVGSTVPVGTLGVRITRRWMDPPYSPSWAPPGQGYWVLFDAKTRTVLLTTEFGEGLLGSPYAPRTPATIALVRNHFPMLAPRSTYGLPR